MLQTILDRLKPKPARQEVNEIAAARSRMFSSAFALQTYNPDDLVQRKGLEIYDQMQSDSQIAATLATKKFAVLSRGWMISEASDAPEDQTVAEFCRYALQQMQGSVEDMLFAVLDAMAKGYSISELNFQPLIEGRFAGKIGLHSIKHKNPANFEIKTDRYLNITGLKQVGLDPEADRDLPAEKFVLYTYMPCYQDPYGRSDLRACYKHWWTKEIILRFFASYIERFGSPMLKGAYKRGTPRSQQDDLLRILDRIQHETAIVVPEDITVELIEAAFHGEAGFQEAIAYHDRQIAKAILGQTLTQEEGQRTGALALAKVHQETLFLRLQKIKRDLEETVMREQVLRPLVRLNFAGAPAPLFRLGSLQDNDLQAETAVIERLVSAGVIQPTEPWIRDWLGIGGSRQMKGA